MQPPHHWTGQVALENRLAGWGAGSLGSPPGTWCTGWQNPILVSSCLQEALWMKSTFMNAGNNPNPNLAMLYTTRLLILPDELPGGCSKPCRDDSWTMPRSSFRLLTSGDKGSRPLMPTQTSGTCQVLTRPGTSLWHATKSDC